VAGEGIFEASGDDAGDGWHRLRPVRARWPWITGGLVLQLIGVGAPAVYVITKAHHENFSGEISKATLTLAWRQAVHSHTGLALLAAGAAVFVIGAVLLARPFVRSWITLFVAIPLAALAGVLVLGVAALVVAVIFAAAGDFFDFGTGWGSGGGSQKRKRDEDDEPDAPLVSPEEA
jgi:hypothetical protein